MIRIFLKYSFLFFALASGVLLLQCQQTKEVVVRMETMINTSHLDSLYHELVVGNDSVGVIHIYSEYPDYKWKGDDDEGIACVDDAARAAIFYIKQYEITNEAEYLRKGKMLLKFLLAMQADNGYYYNFIWEDGTIHKDGRTSLPEPNFWSWRALWAFGETINIVNPDDEFIFRIKAQRRKLVNTLLHENAFWSTTTDTAMGITIPTWLPKGSGTDQASIVLLGLSFMKEQEDSSSIPRDSIIMFIHHFAKGIMMMQVKDPDSLHDGAFLSWENLWHAYANIQAYALMTVGERLEDSLITKGLYEVNHFYKNIIDAGGRDHFWLKKTGDHYQRYDEKQFSQIAYGRRPMIWAALKAFSMTEDIKYFELASELVEWFTGDNPASEVMYDPKTGRGFDGISSISEINRNAGAESTIEALLAMQAMESVQKE